MKNPRAKHNFIGRTCSITGVGSYVPERILTNTDLEKMVETTDEWITTRTGIKERHIAAENEFTSDLASKAALRAMEMAGVTAEQIDHIIVASITPARHQGTDDDHDRKRKPAQAHHHFYQRETFFT